MEELIKRVMPKVEAMTEEERMMICDLGYYNDVMKGYLIEAMKNAEFDEEETKRALNGLRWALSEMTAAEAAETYRRN